MRPLSGTLPGPAEIERVRVASGLAPFFALAMASESAPGSLLEKRSTVPLGTFARAASAVRAFPTMKRLRESEAPLRAGAVRSAICEGLAFGDGGPTGSGALRMSIENGPAIADSQAMSLATTSTSWVPSDNPVVSNGMEERRSSLQGTRKRIGDVHLPSFVSVTTLTKPP